MKLSSLVIAVASLLVATTFAFVPSPPTKAPCFRRCPFLQTAKGAHPEPIKWFFADVVDWFASQQQKANKKKASKKATTTSANKEEQAKGDDAKDDWVEKQFNNNSEEEEGQDGPVITAGLVVDASCFSDNSTLRVVEINKDETETDGKRPDPNVLEMNNNEATDDMLVVPAVVKKTIIPQIEHQEKSESLEESQFAWIQRDMQEAGTAETESKDVVAASIQKQGHLLDDEHDDAWVQKDLEAVGKAENDVPILLKKAESIKKTRRKARNELIADDMEMAGRLTGDDDWVARDMEQAGRLEQDLTSWSWGVDKLSDNLDKQRKQEYDDVFQDMKKTGSQGSDRVDWVARDMEAAGRAVETSERLERLQDQHHGSYSLPEGVRRAYDEEWIRKDMETAGHAESTDWVANDLRHAGHEGSSHQGDGHHWTKVNPPRNEELTDWVSHRQDLIAADMIREGRATTGHAFRQEQGVLGGSGVVSKRQLDDMVARDMKAMGQTSSSSDWVAQDMELVGHDSGNNMMQQHTGSHRHHMSHQERETQAFMHEIRKPKVVPWVPTQKEAGETSASSTAKEEQDSGASKSHKHDDGIHPMRSVRKVAKKAVMPWKPWNKL